MSTMRWNWATDPEAAIPRWNNKEPVITLCFRCKKGVFGCVERSKFYDLSDHRWQPFVYIVCLECGKYVHTDLPQKNWKPKNKNDEYGDQVC